MKEKLVALADSLDKKGLHKEADAVDALIKEAGGVADSLLLALEGIATTLEQISNPAVEKQMGQFATQLVGAKDKFESESAKLLHQLAQSNTQMTRTALIPAEMMERVRGAAAPAAKAAKQLLQKMKSAAPKNKQELEQLLSQFAPIKAVIEKIQRASGA